MLEKNFSGRLEAGIDEAGRGPLAGPVFAAAVILPDDFSRPLLNDSKQLSEPQRRLLRPIIERRAVAWCVAEVAPERIDEINILQATFEAMNQAVEGLTTRPEFLIVDGNRFRGRVGIPYQCIVKGDGKYASIAAASILAKTHRDERMHELHDQFPQYGWDRNAGYPTAEHRRAIELHGLTPHHRTTFRMGPGTRDVGSRDDEPAKSKSLPTKK